MAIGKNTISPYTTSLNLLLRGMFLNVNQMSYKDPILSTDNASSI